MGDSEPAFCMHFPTKEGGINIMFFFLLFHLYHRCYFIILNMNNILRYPIYLLSSNL